MNQNNWIIQTTLGILFCTAGSVLGQTHSPAKPSQISAKRVHNHKTQGLHATPVIFTPAQLATWSEQNNLNEDAAAALDARKYTEAEEDARQSIAIGPLAGIAQELLAQALDAQGKSQEALEVYQQMAFLGNDHARNLLPYSLLLLKAEQWAQAVAAYNKAMSDLADGKLVRANSYFSPDVLQPNELETAIHIALGLTYSSSDSWGKHSQDDKAMHEYQKALTLEPNSALANFYYGRGLAKMRRKVEAKAAYAQASRLGQGDVKAAADEALKGL